MAINVLSASSVSKMFADKWLFKGVSVGLQVGQKVGLVGVNGAGKTTFLKILAGTESPDEGEVARSTDLKIGFLEQIPIELEDQTVWQTVFQSTNPELQAIHDYEQASIGNGDLDKAMEKMNDLNAWDYEFKVKQVLGKLGLHDTGALMGKLSGGQRRRVALARTILQEPDVFVLDEPTNHLDIETIEWLEKLLSAQNATLLVVSHDRYFLDHVTNTIWELDHETIHVSKGNFTKYLENRELRISQMIVTADKAKKIYQRELVWLRRQPKARGTKSKSRIGAAADLKVQSQKKPETRDLNISSQMGRMGKKILELENVSKAYGDNVLIKDFTYTFRRGEKIGIIGPNGIGKSTFLNMITERLAPDSGTVIVGKNTIYGYYEQQGIPISDKDKVIEAVEAVAEKFQVDNQGELSPMQLLNRFLFPPKKQYDYVGKLSGGEKRRLQLLLVLVKQPNFLILDEPTNDLDIFTMEVLGEFLQSFQGCLIIASHDRFFMDQLVEHLFVFEGKGAIRDFPGNYSGYREELALMQKQATTAPAAEHSPKKEKSNTVSTRKASFKEKREYEKLEQEIEKLEAKKADTEAQLNSGEADHQKLTDWGKTLKSIQQQIEESTDRWLELSEII